MKWEMNDAFKVSLIRAVRTGLQAGLGVIIAAQSGWLDMSVLEGAVVAAGAAFSERIINFVKAKLGALN